MKEECQICHALYGQITGSHLKTHNLTRLEYASLFPDHAYQINTTNIVIVNDRTGQEYLGYKADKEGKITHKDSRKSKI